MPIIASPRHKPGDMETWRTLAQEDLIWGNGPNVQAKAEEAALLMHMWASERQGITGVSWGKDSLVVAHMSALYLDWPLVWVKEDPIYNPDCLRVRDAFLALFPAVHYDEITVSLPPNDIGGYHATGHFERGLKMAADRYGPCHISGVRGEESGIRKRMVRRTGGINRFALAPLAQWSMRDVFGYIAYHDLPLHPAYAMSFGGAWPRDRIRISGLTLRLGMGGKQEWEQGYYPEYSEWY